MEKMNGNFTFRTGLLHSQCYWNDIADWNQTSRSIFSPRVIKLEHLKQPMTKLKHVCMINRTLSSVGVNVYIDIVIVIILINGP